MAPCSRVAGLAQRYQSDIVLKHGSVRADAKRVLDLLTLAAGPDAQLELEVSGVDAEAAADAIETLFEQTLAERPSSQSSAVLELSPELVAQAEVAGAGAL